jgi:hypothetical protein
VRLWEAFEAVGWTGGILYAVDQARIAYVGWRYRHGPPAPRSVMGSGGPVPRPHFHVIECTHCNVRVVRQFYGPGDCTGEGPEPATAVVASRGPLP